MDVKTVLSRAFPDANGYFGTLEVHFYPELVDSLRRLKRGNLTIGNSHNFIRELRDIRKHTSKVVRHL